MVSRTSAILPWYEVDEEEDEEGMMGDLVGFFFRVDCWGGGRVRREGGGWRSFNQAVCWSRMSVGELFGGCLSSQAPESLEVEGE